MTKLKKRKLQLLALCTGFTALTLGVLFSSGKGLGIFTGGASTRSGGHSITLNSSNKVTSAGDKVQKTAQGGEVTFTYSSVQNSTGGHATLNSGGYVVNKDIITSISTITASYSGSGALKARIAYTTEKWGDYFDVASDAKIETGSHPYFVEFKADGGSLTLNSVKIEFTCTENPDAQPQAASDVLTNSNTVNSTANSYKEWETKGSSGAVYEGQSAGEDGTIQLRSKNSNSGIVTSTSGGKIGKVAVEWSGKTTAGRILNVYGSNSEFSDPTDLYGSSSLLGSIDYGSSTEFTFSGDYSHVGVRSKDGALFLDSITFTWGGNSAAPITPTAVEIGFTADDSKKDSYTTNSVFANNNGLLVQSVYSDSSTTPVAAKDYSYVIKDSNNNTIDPTQKFPAVGTYTLIVSYGNYTPHEIKLHVGEYIWVTDIAAAMTKTTFTTADKLADYISSSLTATLEYSNDTQSSAIPYSEFANYGLAVKLVTPKGITFDINNLFGTAGAWTLKVYNIEDEDNMRYNIQLTVNAILVETITLNEESYELHPEGQLQLEASINPGNATNGQIVWASDNEPVATVSEDGLVTAVALGTANITATAVDGSNVYGTCVISVVEKPADPQYTVVTDLTTLKAGDVIVLANSSSKREASGETASTQYATFMTVVDYETKPAPAFPLTLVTGSTSGSFGLKNGNKYLSWDSSIGNGLTTSTTLNSNSSWILSGSGSIKNVSDTSRYIEYNATSPRFACYKSSQTDPDVLLYTNSAPAQQVYPTDITVTGTSPISIGGTSQLEVTYTPADTTVRNVTFTSNNTSVATVSAGGLITGVAQGSTTITVTAEKSGGTITKTFNITVTPISVTSVVLDASSASVKVGKTTTLVATVNPSNATNKNVNWSSNATSVATVSNTGVVTGVAAGQATITVTSAADSTKKATCVVTVTASGGEEEYGISYTDLPSTYQTGTTVYTASSGIKFQAYNCANYSSKMQFKASSGYLQNTESLELQSVTINDRESNTLTVYGSNVAGSFSTEITGTNDVYDLTGYSYFKIARTASGAGYCSSVTVVTGTPTPTDPTGIILSPTSAELGVGGTKQLSVSYVPSNANQNKDITWTSSDTNVATVSSSGLVTVKSTATAGQTATITAKLTKFTSITATCTITVTAQKKDDHTVLIYICGADLESENSLATGDIQEILKVSGQPDDVNIVIETGGASSWASTYGISSSKLERWHVENKSLVKDASLTYASMGLTSTLQSFIEYGLNNYPAERTGLVLWNHGGGMHGVCYDEKKSDDSLLDNEVKSAVSGALSNCGMSGQKLEWIGYDACLMQVQDIAEMNSSYFNYMIASEESEAGYGWDYDNWVDDLYAKKTTGTILQAIVDSFMSDNGGVNSSSSDQTLSYLDLSKASAYRTAWENMAAQLQTKLTSSNKSTFNNAIKNNVKHFADSDYDYFCLFDARDFIQKLASNSAFSSFSIGTTYTDAVLSAFSQLVVYSKAQKGAGNAFGLCMYWCNDSTYSDMSVYTTSHTNFTTWRSINNTYGTHK